MPEELKLDRARALARSLTTINGFPRYDEVIEATAEDLVRWCRGADIDGEHWSPERQAYWLVTEAREKIADRWESTAALLAMFNKKFVTVKAGNGFVDYSKEPCICGSGKKFKDCCQPHPGEEPPATPTIRKPTLPTVPRRPITQADIEDAVKKRKP